MLLIDAEECARFGRCSSGCCGSAKPGKPSAAGQARPVSKSNRCSKCCRSSTSDGSSNLAVYQPKCMRTYSTSMRGLITTVSLIHWMGRSLGTRGSWSHTSP